MLDNLNDSTVLEIVPPLGSLGAMVVTSRDPTIAFGTTSATIQLQPFDQVHGSTAILNLLGRKTVSEAEKSFASDISAVLGGLPLAITQISGFIAQQRLSLSTFVTFYERNAAKINKRAVPQHQNEQILSTVWALAIETMESNPRRLQSLLAFLDPDKICEVILTQGIPHLSPDDLKFVLDDFE